MSKDMLEISFPIFLKNKHSRLGEFIMEIVFVEKKTNQMHAIRCSQVQQNFTRRLISTLVINVDKFFLFIL